MLPRRAIALAFGLGAALVSERARAWSEAHEIGDDAQVVVDARGVASVRHRLRWHVVRGPLRAIELAPVDPKAGIEPAASVTTDDGRSLVAHAVRTDERTLRITIDEPRALSRGDVTVDVGWTIDLPSAGALSPDGSTWRLAWTAPAALDGFDTARVTFDVGAAPEAPRPILADTGVTDDSAFATLHRGPERDRLELVRPHVARGEAVIWTLRLDPRALPLLPSPRSFPPSAAAAAPEPNRVREVSIAALLAALGLVFGRLVACKARAFRRVCSAGGLEATDGLLPVPERLRPTLAGCALAAAVGLEVAGENLAGAVCVSLAIVAAAVRAPGPSAAARGPGRWQVLPPERAFAAIKPRWGHWLDVGAPAGRCTALGAVAVIGLVALVARRLDGDAVWWGLLDSSALLPLLFTGRSAQLPPHAFHSAVPWLARAFRRLQFAAELSVTPWARVAPDGVAADELRLLVQPRAPVPGVIGVEVGLAWTRLPIGWAAAPEVLARVIEGSAACAKLADELPAGSAGVGRRAQERVVRWRPRTPTRASTVAFIREVVRALTVRRVTVNEPGERCRHDDESVAALIDCGPELQG